MRWDGNGTPTRFPRIGFIHITAAGYPWHGHAGYGTEHTTHGQEGNERGYERMSPDGRVPACLPVLFARFRPSFPCALSLSLALLFCYLLL